MTLEMVTRGRRAYARRQGSAWHGSLLAPGMLGPRRQAEVVTPGRDLNLPDLEDSGHRQFDVAAAHRKLIETLGQNNISARGDVEDFELYSL